MRFLRTNTATRVTVGPFFDRTDGVTPETAITVTACKLTLMVDTGGVPTLVLDTNPTASGGANDMVHVTGDDAGFYDLELAAADVNYLGRAKLAITDAATHCPVFEEFMILPAMIYDSLVLGTDRFDANVTHVADTAQTGGDIFARVLDAAGVRSAVGLGSANLDTQLDNLPTNTDLATALASSDDAVLAAVDALPTNAELATALAAADDAILAAIAALNNLSAAAVNAEVDTAISDAALATAASIAALNNLSAAGVRAAVGLGAANLDTQLDALPTGAELATALAAADDAVLTAIGALNDLDSTQVQTAAAAALAAAEPIEANVVEIAGTLVTGDGDATPWGPA